MNKPKKQTVNQNGQKQWQEETKASKMLTKPIWIIIDEYELQNSDGCAKAAMKHDDERKKEASKKNTYQTRRNMKL